jgi:hypothetical protein
MQQTPIQITVLPDTSNLEAFLIVKTYSTAQSDVEYLYPRDRESGRDCERATLRHKTFERLGHEIIRSLSARTGVRRYVTHVCASVGFC